ncbi:unnamed protein product [Lymnaea stagnalis]|uniref:J domain-containing protein n=1 Tax=Lymnaea stagnalis TaxID=6523 RepID=A0AAV2HW66_LYMST
MTLASPIIFHSLINCKKCVSYGCQSLYKSVACIHSFGRQSATMKHKQISKISEYYSLLDVDKDCTEDELRDAYLKKVKVYHPDTKTANGDANKFAQIQEAYKTAMAHKRSAAVHEEEAKKAENQHVVEHTVPQHRQYLTFEGVGFGSPSKRERQYKQVRVAQAAESVYEHRKLKYGSNESALLTKDKVEARKIKISNLIDRVVDDMIRESMQKGDFDNLSGYGKPLDRSDYNPFIDLTTHNINKIMANNGFKPEWIMLSKEIRDSICTAREKLAVLREQLGPPPYSEESEVRWNFHIDKFKNQVEEINQMINKYNFIVPFMERQMVHYNVGQIIQDISDGGHVKYLPTDKHGQPLDATQLAPLPKIAAEQIKINWKEVWCNIRDVFTVR